MPSLQDLMQKKADLERQIEQTKKSERSGAVAKVRALMSEYGLTAADLKVRGRAAAPKKAAKTKTGKKVPAKYRNTQTGETWSGRGLQPRWLKAAIAGGKKIADFAV